MKTPMTLGQKKTKAIEQLLDELGVGRYYHEAAISVWCIHVSDVGSKPMSTEQICVQFNELR